jgi:hypothetical protein
MAVAPAESRTDYISNTSVAAKETRSIVVSVERQNVIPRSASYNVRKLLASVKEEGRGKRGRERDDERKVGKKNKGVKDGYDAGGGVTAVTTQAGCSDNVSYRVTSFVYVVYTRGEGARERERETTISRPASLFICLFTPLNFRKLAGFEVLTAASIDVSEKCTASVFMLEK